MADEVGCHDDMQILSREWKRSTVHCWPLLHVMAGISARFSNFAFVLFCYITNHLRTGPLGNSEFCFPRISMYPSTSSRETLRFSGNKINCSPRDQSLSVYYCQFFYQGCNIRCTNKERLSTWREIDTTIWFREGDFHFLWCYIKGSNER